MFNYRLLDPVAVCVFAVVLSGCIGSFRRDDDAARAKTRMIGMSKEEVLACMGIPKKKASEGATEVWSYLSTDDYGVRTQDSFKVTSYYSTKPSTYEKRFCTENVVIRDGVVRAVHYLDPTGTTILNDYDQCGYAVAACVE
jgi:outer membrane protein assembly factor BamE (lipoprotein component of BamABCDE complex)